MSRPWNESELLVLDKIRELGTVYRDTHASVEKLDGRVSDLSEKVTTLMVKVAMIGTLAGIVAAALVSWAFNHWK